MGMIQEIWDKITGKPRKEAPPEPETRQERGERIIQAQATRADELRLGIAPEQVQARNQTEASRQHSVRQAENLKQPGPAERAVTHKDLFVDQTRQALKQERFATQEMHKEIAEEKKPPLKSFSELHPKSGPTTPQL
jgi:hypothetical protein